jgi:hypothetical protein
VRALHESRELCQPKRSKLGSVEEPSSQTRQVGLHQSTLFWGCVGAVLTVVITVIAAMIKDIRWALFIAWPFAGFAVYEFAKTWVPGRIRKAIITVSGAAISGLALLGLYIALEPLSSPTSAAVQITPIPLGLNQTVLFECEGSQLPEVVPQDGLYDFQITGTSLDGSYVSPSQKPGTKLDWSNNLPIHAYLCRFSNFGKVPILNVQTDMTLNYREVLKIENGTKAGAIINTKTISTPRINLEGGKSNGVELYFRNRSMYWVEIFVPTEAKAQVIGNNQWQTIKLIPSGHFGSFALPPFTPKQPLPEVIKSG